MKTILALFLLTLPLARTAEKPPLTKEEAFKTYSNLVGGTWETKGTWENGGAFHQEIVVETELTNNIFTVRTHDYIDSRKFENSQRNYGIRAWDNTAQKMKFFEFDVFGGIISGDVVIDGRDIYHVYEYPDRNGRARTLADAWIYVDKDTYTYKVCDFADGKAGKEYLSSTYTRK